MHGTPKYSEDGEYYFINGNNLSNGKIVLDNKTKKIDYCEYKRIGKILDKSILFSINGTIGNIALYNNENVALGKSVAYFIKKSNKILLKYLYFYLQSKWALNYFEKNLTGSTIKNLGLKVIRDFQIPVPSLEEQQRIIDILDRFDKLCNDISEGLPAEIEARQKQYEYYRDKLLTFKPLEEEK